MMQHWLPMLGASSFTASRRRLLKLGIGTAAVFTAVGGAAWIWQPGWRAGRLSESGRAVFRAVGRCVLDGNLPTEPVACDAALDRHLARLEATIAGLHPAARAELSQLLGLLALAPARRSFTGLSMDWADAGIDALEPALRRMRSDAHPLRQQAYHALRDLTNAAYYAQPEHWMSMGYPGPPAV